MAKPLAPGWYPDPNGKRANTLYWDGEEWHTAPPPPPPARRKKRRVWPWVLGIVLVLFLIGRCSDGENQSSQTPPSASPSQSVSPTSKEPFPTEYMPGNGTYEMGGVDGKDWGVWQADGAPVVSASGLSAAWPDTGEPTSWTADRPARARRLA